MKFFKSPLICIVVFILIFSFPKQIFSENITPEKVAPKDNLNSIQNTIKTKWVNPDGEPPISYNQWVSEQDLSKPFKCNSLSLTSSSGLKDGSVSFCVVVNDLFYPSIELSLNQYILDLTGEGFNVELLTVSGGTPEDLRLLLADRYSSGLQGCLFVGDLPIAWFETNFGDPPEHAEFPIDLFYMDLDGVFEDSDFDGLYDSHTGNIEPDIYMGRLTASPLIMKGDSESDLVNNYFRKNHLYRCGLLPAESKALVYIDDDWAPGNWWNLNVGLAYSNREFVRDRWETWGPDYIGRLPIDYEFIQVCVHSWSGGHAFKNPAEEWSWVYNSEIVATQPKAHFYNLFACSNALYVEQDYSSGWYIFGDDYGLASIGSTKSGSMLAFDDFYGPLGDGKSIGQAYFDWFAAQAEGGFEEWEISWFYGMTLNGDPTLTTQKKSNTGIIQHDDGNIAYIQALPHPSGWDLYNVRFTPAEACTLLSVMCEGDFPSTGPIRLYVWESDGTFPTNLIDSLDIPNGDLGYINISDLNLVFDTDEDFHIGFTCLESTPVDTNWFSMDAGIVQPEIRSSIYRNDAWQTLAQVYGNNYNLCIRAEVKYDDEPEIEITTTSLPNGMLGVSYEAPLSIVGGLPPFTLELTAGELPDGIILDSQEEMITGTPNGSGMFIFSVKVTDNSAMPLSDVQHLSVSFEFICGDINGDGSDPNISDLTFLVDFLFAEGPNPPSDDAADINNDETLGISDLT
ncbi:MAG: hypothetical protein U9N54_05710, partial [candidate division Zixibacteria bacterium]|nr:hypothetical protein [candidate division Zixibacteria bacterium]